MMASRFARCSISRCCTTTMMKVQQPMMMTGAGAGSHLRVAAASVRSLSSYYTPAHEYVKVEGNVGVCGITDFAQAALGDIVFVDLPDVGDEFEKGDSFSSVESVKAASDVYAPVSGTVVEVNENLVDDPGLVNSSAEGDAWFVKIEISDSDEVSSLMNEADYKEHCEKEAH